MTAEAEDPSGDLDPDIPFDVTVPHIARVYDYFLGGKDNFAVDRQAAEEFIEAMPSTVTTIRLGQRPVLGRVVRFLVTECGVRQFLDVGAGLPTAENTHEAAQRADPRCKIVYVDNDPMVLAHARALLTGGPDGAITYVEADVRDTGKILARAAGSLDFTEPVGVVLSGILHCVSDRDDPFGIVARLVEAVPSGSYVYIAHPASDVDTGAPQATARLNTKLAAPVTFRDHAQVTAFFDGLELVEPGVVQPQQWRPDPGSPQPGRPLSLWCGVARKP